MTVLKIILFVLILLPLGGTALVSIPRAPVTSIVTLIIVVMLSMWMF
jgi:hypothetical protein